MTHLTPNRSAELPRVAYVGDVVPERTVAGQLLLYRLLAEYPPEKLMVAYSPIASQNEPEKRLPGVRYVEERYVPLRLIRNRFARYVRAMLPTVLPMLTRRVRKHLVEHRAEAVVSVPTGYMWLAAHQAARQLGLPHHVIFHDDWLSCNNPPRVARWYLRRLFADAYRSAQSRLCVSPLMADLYERDYGVPGSVLYPSRGPDSPEPRVRYRHQPDRPFTVAYFGSLWISSYVRQLEEMADALQEIGGRLVFFSPHQAKKLEARANVHHRGYKTPSEIASEIEGKVDLLFCPMAFEPSEEHRNLYSFPSKLADYTVMGLPILVSGPASCSAIRWARENADSVVSLTEPGSKQLLGVIRQMKADPEQLARLADGALRAGEADFALASGRRVLYGHLAAGREAKS